ncbi:MAG TPA: MBOAT family protein [Tepidisphaeraceae bacterium]
MLFNSYEFIFLFLPLCLAGYALLGYLGRHRAALAWVVVCSLVYYAWWKPPELDHWTPRFLLIMVASVAVNYLLGTAILSRDPADHRAIRAVLLGLGILFNFGLLAYFKYTGFFLSSINSLFDASIAIPTVILPLAFSFHTFQQHAYLVDAWHGRAGRYSPLDYSLFVLFFPQLLAGPIVHHREMLPQLSSHRVGHVRARHVAVGLSMFVIGLFKKVMVADRVGALVAPVFGAAAAGRSLTFGDAWLGALAFTFQLYFDFSAYSDMAIGVARMLGLRLPMNFNSPYQAASVIDFWRRWHMTLSRWLRDYVYIPMGGNRRGATRRWINLMATMLIGGLWHGAGWTFVFWGGLHGFYLGVNHAWRRLRRRGGPPGEMPPAPSRLGQCAGVLVTFFAVTVAWVFFRAPDFASAWRMLGAMFGRHGFTLQSRFGDRDEAILLSVLLLAVWRLPNTQQMLDRFRPALGYRRGSTKRGELIQWRPNLWWAAGLSIVAVVAITHLSYVREFIYYQF